jgi:hypothetical protein
VADLNLFESQHAQSAPCEVIARSAPHPANTDHNRVKYSMVHGFIGPSVQTSNPFHTAFFALQSSPVVNRLQRTDT